MSTRYVYLDETKRAGYVMAAVAVADPAAVRTVIRGLVQPGNRRLHMVDERPRHRPRIVSALVETEIEVTIYDAVRNYRTDREARSACLAVLVEDLAITGAKALLVIEQDDSLVRFVRHELYQLAREAGITDILEYRHQRRPRRIVARAPRCSGLVLGPLRRVAPTDRTDPDQRSSDPALRSAKPERRHHPTSARSRAHFQKLGSKARVSVRPGWCTASGARRVVPWLPGGAESYPRMGGDAG